jgi:murein DD-endopeptidase MepM/ murein hydrolase activator NlpD
MHMADEERVWAGTQVRTGDPIGHPSCLGGFSTGAHLHFARRYNGEWMPVEGGPSPLVLSSWAFQAGEEDYDGTMSADGVTLESCVCRDGNGVTKHGPTAKDRPTAATVQVAKITPPPRPITPGPSQ